jgi:hypothetical protein
VFDGHDGWRARSRGAKVAAQAHDTVVFEGKGRALLGVSGVGLFEPSALGLKPIPWVAALWRGYRVTYAVRSDRLILERLVVGVGGDSSTQATEPQSLFGRELKRSGRGPVALDELAEPVDFSGGLLVGHEFIGGLDVGMSYHPAWRWRSVHELLFESGVLKAALRSFIAHS